MADIQGFDPTSGQPITVPQETAASEYHAGKLRFNPKDRVPIKLRGVEGTIAQSELDAALEAGGELNFDPHGAAKATAAGALSSVPLGDWLAVEGSRFIGGDANAEHTRKVLEGLQQAHPEAHTAGMLGGTVAQLLIPGEGEVAAERAAVMAPEKVAAASKLMSGEEAAGLLTAGAQQAGQTVVADAAANAAAGRTVGSALGRTLRAVDPFTYIGKAGSSAEQAIGRVLGPGKASHLTAGAARIGLEGSLLGAANAVDESELGDTPLTAEGLLAGASEGALWGGTLGLVGAAGKRVLTSAGRLADKLSGKLATGSIHGTPGQIDKFMHRFGEGPGEFMLSNGWHPAMSGEGQYNWASNLRDEAGSAVAQIAKDAGRGGDLSALAAYERVERATREPLQIYGTAGGNANGLREELLKKTADSFGIEAYPEAPPPVTPAHVETMVDDVMRQRGFRIPNTVDASEKAIEKAARARVEKIPFTAQDVSEHVKGLIADARARGITLPADALQPESLRAGLIEKRMGEARVAAKEELLGKYGQELKAYENVRSGVRMEMESKAREAETIYNNRVEAIRRRNESKTVSFEHGRNFRQVLDHIVPWGQINTLDQRANTAAKVKFAARDALEGAIEESIDKAAGNLGDPEMFGRYLHAKRRYSMAASIEEMARKGRAREATWFGRPSRVGGLGGHLAAGLLAAATGHPFAGAAAMVGGAAARHYGPRLAAYTLYRASKLARLKALRQEVAIAARRGVRSAFGETPHSPHAQLGVPDVAPHEMRMTAAKAMEHVAGLADNPASLRSRLAAQDPALVVYAPNTFEAAHKAFNLQVAYLGMQIPGRLKAQLAQTGHINPRDVTDHEAREFMSLAAVAQDPRVATDAIATGAISDAQMKAAKAMWPGIMGVAKATAERQKGLNHDAFEFLHPSRKSHLESLIQDTKDAQFTLTLQAMAQSAVAGQQATAPPGKGGAAPKGMTHAASTAKGMGMTISLMNTQSQLAESGSPGRRGRRGSASSDSGM